MSLRAILWELDRARLVWVAEFFHLCTVAAQTNPEAFAFDAKFRVAVASIRALDHAYFAHRN